MLNNIYECIILLIEIRTQLLVGIEALLEKGIELRLNTALVFVKLKLSCSIEADWVVLLLKQNKT